MLKNAATTWASEHTTSSTVIGSMVRSTGKKHMNELWEWKIRMRDIKLIWCIGMYCCTWLLLAPVIFVCTSDEPSEIGKVSVQHQTRRRYAIVTLDWTLIFFTVNHFLLCRVRRKKAIQVSQKYQKASSKIEENIPTVNLLNVIKSYPRNGVPGGPVDASANILSSHYLQETDAVRNDDPLKYWFAQPESNVLRQIALRHLMVSPTSVPVERLFSSAGNVVSPLRTRLTTDHVNETLVLYKNQWLPW